jgi:hypothetical protein
MALDRLPGDQPCASASTYRRSTGEAIFAIAYRSGPIIVTVLDSRGESRSVTIAESSPFLSVLTSFWKFDGSSQAAQTDPLNSARAVAFVLPLAGGKVGPPVLVALCRDRCLRFWNAERKELISTVQVFEREDDRGAPQLESKHVFSFHNLLCLRLLMTV